MEWNQKSYNQEVDNKGKFIGLLLEKAQKGTITLLYSSKEDKYNNAIALNNT